MKKNILIVMLLILSCLFGYYSYNNNKQLKKQKELIESGYYSNGTYVDVNLSKDFKELKKENKELYDSLKQYKDEIDFLTQFKYHKEYITDTIYVKEKTIINNDSIKTYEYSNNGTDTLNYKLSIGSITEPVWYKLKIETNDKFTIINKNIDNVNRTTIESQNNGVISDVAVFNKNENKFSNHFSHGIVIGGGYGVVNNKFDVFVGYGITIKF